MKFKIKKITSIFLISSSFGVIASFLPTILMQSGALSLNSKVVNNSGENVDKTTGEIKDENSNKLQPIDFNDSWPLLSTDSGPITSNKNIISALDWFASTRWTIDVLNLTWQNQRIFSQNATFVKWTDRAFINWDYDRKNNYLWLLTNSEVLNKKVQKQKLIKLDATNGNVLLVKELNFDPNTKNNHEPEYNLYYSISALNSGKVMLYSQGTPAWYQFDLYDPVTNTVKTSNTETKNMVGPINDDLSKQPSKGDVRVRFFFPISNNRNILVLTSYGWWNQQNYDKNNFGDLWIVLVDDNMNQIGNEPAKKIVERSEMGNLNSEGDTFPKLYYTLADGRVLFTAFNKMFIFFTNDIVSGNKLVYKELNYGIKVDGKYNSVESWTTDTDNNVYVKFSNDNKIYKVKITGSSSSNTSFHQSTYYDLSGSPIDEIRKHASSFAIYNVYGYSGQIMLLNPRKVTNKEKIDEIKDDNSYEYGLAAAIIQNKNGEGGDSKGLLNTDKAFIKSSDFTINQDILQNKLPSEISRNDLTITEGGFLTRNNTIDSSTGELKYKQFEKTKIDDKNKTFTVTANIDQIPWFVNNGIMPSNIPPLTITKEFTTDSNIDTRVTWKDASLDYNFKNTLPSKVTLDDVKKFDPFNINIISQATIISGKSYPNKDYEIVARDDSKGTILIKTSYHYIPVDVDAKATSVVTQEFTKEYQIFKKDDHKSFNFIGKQAENTQENIKDIPQLKELSQSNLLPSSFNSNDTQSILKFVNTDTSKGFPLNKMTFTVTPDDINGTLTISGKIQDGYYDDTSLSKEFKKTYIGLNKIGDYSLNLSENPSNFIKKNYRPSDISEQIIYADFLRYQGFNSSDIKIELTPNDAKGELGLKVILNGSYPLSVVNKVGFVENNGVYSRDFIIDGFKTTNEYQEQFSIIFKDDNDRELDSIKKYTPNQIRQILKKEVVTGNDELFIGKTKITNEKELALNVISKKGSNIPKETDQNFESQIYYNDSNGEITVKLTYKNVPGTSENLVFIQRFTGFAKGNQVPTNDILSFKTETKLFLDNPKFKEELPSVIKERLDNKETRVSEIQKFLSFYSGAYKTAIENDNFQLEVVEDNIFGYLTIKISFDRKDVSDTNSLLEYTATYKGFLTE